MKLVEKDAGQWKQAAAAYAGTLSQRNMHEDAAVSYLAAKLPEQALASYRAAGQWQMAFALAGKLLLHSFIEAFLLWRKSLRVRLGLSRAPQQCNCMAWHHVHLALSLRSTFLTHIVEFMVPLMAKLWTVTGKRTAMPAGSTCHHMFLGDVFCLW